MKSHLLFFVTLFFSRALLAQNPSCQAFIWPTDYENGATTLTVFDSAATQAVSYLWSTGENTPEIDVTADGIYCVTVTFADGCTAGACDSVYTSNCSVYASTWSVGNGYNNVVAYHYPSYLDASWLWSNGENTQQFLTNQSGTYTVTVTLENGCTSVASVNVNVNPPQCDIDIYRLDSLETGSVWLYASAWPGNANYTWSTGETTSSIEVTQAGTYCVTATNSNGCSATECITINCGVDVDLTSNGNLVANSVLGTAPFTYAWSDSSTTQTITPPTPGFYCVTITDATGCTSIGCAYTQANPCHAYITYNSDNSLTANSVGAAPFTYLWSPGGYTTQTVTPSESGYYSVAVIDANGCQGAAYSYWYAPADCRVDIFTYADSTPVSGSVFLYAQAPGAWSDWQFNWSNGDSGNQILAVSGGEYCVTATNTLSGCTASACFWVQPDGACTAQISGAEVDALNWELSVTGSPAPIVSYAWSTGATTPTTQVSAAGHYTVTITNNAGCTVSAFYDLYDTPSTMYVQVLLQDSIAAPGNGLHASLYLIEYDPAQGGTLTAIDTVETYSWSNSWALGSFINVAPGNYLVKAALLPGSTGYADYLPTYYQNALLWSDATTVSVSALSNQPVQSNVYIQMVEGQNPGGPGFVGGLVSEGANLSGSGDAGKGSGEGDPYPGASVVLTLANGTPVAAAVTGADGKYAFGNLAWGTYILTLDIPGIAPVSITITIGPDQPSIGNLDFKVDDNSAVLPVTDVADLAPVRVFPNPAHEQVAVVLPADAELTLTNAQGQLVLQKQENAGTARLNLPELPAGIYFLTARMTGSSQILRVMIE
jgi:hypothetical protein